ncbi:MAG TPA: hypothetical protein VLD17_09500 [Gemmatimonadaceae bacterium]|nr:hypothetical protein [Gemmatimonadaceae bacterium]
MMDRSRFASVARRLLGGVALAAMTAACATYWPTISGTSTHTRGDAFTCSMDQLKELGYTPRTWNEREGSIDAQRINREASGQLAQEQQQVDKLVVQTKANGERGSTIEVRTETVLRHYTRSGWVEDGRPASEAVQQSGKALLDRCSGAAPAG